MMNARELKERLRMIEKNQLQLDDDQVIDLTYQMLLHIGSTDPELRDELIYSILVTWIDNNRLSKKRLREILMECLKKHVLFHIGESDTDSVFTRSFSVLIVTAILRYHNFKLPFLEEKEISEIKEIMFTYAQLEKDFRGYVLEKGWAHSVAHFADCLDEIALCDQVNQEDLKQILYIIRAMMSTRDITFNYGEDERMVTAIISIIKRNLVDQEVVLHWVHELSVLDIHHVLPNDNWHARNIKNLFRSLYFRSLEDIELSWLRGAVLQCLKERHLKFK